MHLTYNPGTCSSFLKSHILYIYIYIYIYAFYFFALIFQYLTFTISITNARNMTEYWALCSSDVLSFHFSYTALWRLFEKLTHAAPLHLFINMAFDGCGTWFYCFKTLHAFLSSPTLATNPAHLILLIFYHPYTIWWEVQTPKFLIMQFPLTCCCLEFQISSSAPTTQHPQPIHIQLHIYHTHFYARYEAKPYPDYYIIHYLNYSVISTQNFMIMNYMTIFHCQLILRLHICHRAITAIRTLTL